MKFVLINKMKATKLILILALIVSCFSDECSIRYEEKVISKCTSMGSCDYNNDMQLCFPIKACSEVDPADCLSTRPPDFKKYKCVLSSDGSVCSSAPRECIEYWPSCQDFSTGTENDRCDVDNFSRCKIYKNSCSLPFEECINNIPLDYSQECDYDGEQCISITRKCNDYYLSDYHRDIMNEAFCQKLDPSDPTIEKTCHFVEGQCKDIYEKCSSYTGDDEDTCLAISPLKTEEGNVFTEIYKCAFNDATTPKCKSERKKCSDYNGDSSLCPSLLSQDTNKECFFDGTDCIEKYKTCQLYFNSLSAEDKTKEKCINFRPLSQAHNCIWEGTSETSGECKELYTQCSAYHGNDKEICIAIPGCTLDKDTTCIKKVLTCEEATNANLCKTAKPFDSTKQCIFYEGKCFEDYKTCEDYKGFNKPTCEGIFQFNGKKCFFDYSHGCVSYNKICSEAIDKRECKLIAKTGVSNPDRKVCTFDLYDGSETCFENYKYCSDYKVIASVAEGYSFEKICSRIKPYNSEGNKIDTDYRCSYDYNGVGCKKILFLCFYAKNAEQCAKFCDKLDNKQHYVYYKDSSTRCVPYYKECKDAPLDKCDINIPEANSTTHQCQIVGSECKLVPKPCYSFIDYNSL